MDRTAIVIVVDHDRALILQRGETAPWKPLAWDLPGGGIDVWETPKKAAIREVLEEVGHPLYEWVLERVQEPWVDEKLGAFHVFVARTGLIPVSYPDQEHIDHRWVSSTELTDYDLVPIIKPLILKTLHRSQDAEYGGAPMIPGD